MDPRSGWEGKDEPARRGEDGGVIEGCGGVLLGLLAQAITLVCENCLKLLRRWEGAISDFQEIVRFFF